MADCFNAEPVIERLFFKLCFDPYIWVIIDISLSFAANRLFVEKSYVNIRIGSGCRKTEQESKTNGGKNE